MDTTHLHLMLDRIREDQHIQGSLLIDVIERQDESLRILRGIGKLLRDKPSRSISLPPGAVMTGLQYLAVAAALIVMLKGGDLEPVAKFVKVFGLF